MPSVQEPGASPTVDSQPRKKTFPVLKRRLGIDMAAWTVALSLGTLLPSVFGPTRIELWWVFPVVALAAVLQMGMGLVQGLYTEGSHYSALDEFGAVTKSVGVTTALLVVVNFFISQRPLPMTILVGGALALGLMGAWRLLWRFNTGYRKLVRVMPNLGAQLRQAVLCVVFPEGTDTLHRERITGLLGLLGDVIELEEDLIDAATAIMGCSPGYLALMAEILVEAGVKEGLTEDQTTRMVSKAMSATGGLLELHDPGALKRAVASPGGMTEAGLDALEERKIREILLAAVDASLDRARE